jgi:hypothetical protein
VIVVSKVLVSKVSVEHHHNLCSAITCRNYDHCYLPENIECRIVDVMRVVRLIPINDLSLPTFNSWATRILGYLDNLPTTAIHLVFDDYRARDCMVYLSPDRLDKGRETRISVITQTLPKI